MRIAETFVSLQGEGKLAGVPSAFVRTSGCNLRCAWCDTPYASWKPEGPRQTVADVADWVGSAGVRHVVLTGGEPLIQPDLPDLVRVLAGRGLHLTLETAGTLDVTLEGVSLLSLSPKLSNSTPAGRFARVHEARRVNGHAMRNLIARTRDAGGELQVKFVVRDPGDLPELQACLDTLGDVAPADVLLMPEGTDAATLSSRSGWLADLCLREGFRFCPRLHVYLYGNTRGT